MRLSLLFSVSLLLALPAARAQSSADDFFNRGAHFYISNNIPQALAPVEAGLKQYPDDVKLKKLYELLKQQQQSQSSQSQQNQNQQNQSQQQQNQQNSQEQQKQNEQNQSGQKNDEQKKKQQQPSSGDKQNGQKQENQNEQGQSVAAGQMTPEEAKRLLDAQKGNEQVLQLKPQGKPETPNRPIKDW
jgi:Ca-activated chloride channel family protein